MNTNTKIQGRDLINLGWEQGPAIGTAVQAANELLQAGTQREEIMSKLVLVNTVPKDYVNHEVWADTAAQLMEARQEPYQLREEPAPLTVWGRDLIDEGSFEQINNAAQLPVTLKVALMPDAHIGYGLPIGGVAALDGAIAPYMVGVDIGCRMHATIFDRNPIHLDQDKRGYVKYLQEHTYFGRQGPPKKARNQHAILDDPRWAELPHHLKGLKEKAAEQLGTSGGGNHFVEWTELAVYDGNPLGLDPGKYIALVSHSGSRAVGYKIANWYTKVAERMCSFLPKELRHLAWLNHNTEAGQEYEMAMNLAGDFARANHEVIHRRISEDLGMGAVVATLQNHHNFAWRVEREDGAPIFIHRKGATPAAKDVLGIIPGSMATPGFFVKGLGETPDKILDHPSLNSAAHGSGRVLGRRQAIKTLDQEAVRRMLKKRGVTLIGGGLDEAPDAYKDSRQVLAAQSDLVEIWAEFKPNIVRMEAPRGKGLGKGT